MHAVFMEAGTQGLQGNLLRMRKRALIQTPDKSNQGLFLVKKGTLRLYKISDEGKQFTLDILSSGQVFGELDSFELGSSDVFIECIDDTELLWIDKKQFEVYLMAHPYIAVKFLGVLSKRLKEREFTLQNVVFSDVRERILNLLERLVIEFGLDHGDYSLIDIPLTHQEIANMIGATRESVSSIMRDLVREDYIVTGRKTIKVNRKKRIASDR